MSHIGESMAYAKDRNAIAPRLDTEKLSPVERTRLLAEWKQADREYRCAWSMAREECEPDDETREGVEQ